MRSGRVWTGTHPFYLIKIGLIFNTMLFVFVSNQSKFHYYIFE